MFARLPDWSGPDPRGVDARAADLAEGRRQAVLETLQRAGTPVLAERVVIGPSPYPGARGIEAADQYLNTIFRNQAASQAFPLPPAESASMGVR